MVHRGNAGKERRRGSQLCRKMSRKGGISLDWRALRSFAAKSRAKVEYRSIGVRGSQLRRKMPRKDDDQAIGVRLAALQ